MPVTGPLIATAIITTAIKIGLNVALGALNKPSKPSVASFAIDSARQQTTVLSTQRQAMIPERMILGMGRIGGAPVEIEKALPAVDSKLRWVWIVTPVMDGEGAGPVTFHLDDSAVSPFELNAGSRPSAGRFKDVVVYKWRNGDQTEALPDLVNELEGWSASDVGHGVSYFAMRVFVGDSNFPTQQIPRWGTVWRGRKIFDPRDGQTRWTDNAVLCARHWLLDPRFGPGSVAGVDDADIAAQANICDEMVPVGVRTVSANVAGGIVSIPKAEIGSVKTGDFFAADGGAFAGYVHTVTDTGAGSGLVQFSMAATLADAQGGPSIVPPPGAYSVTRSVTADAEIAANVVRVNGDFMRVLTGQKVAARDGSFEGYVSNIWYNGFGHPEGQTVFQLASSLTAAREFHVMTLPSGSGVQVSLTHEPRYTVNGVILGDEDRRKVQEQLADAMAGFIVDTGGEWLIRAGAYRAPDFTLEHRDIAGPVTIQRALRRDERANVITGQYNGPWTNHQPGAFRETIDEGLVALEGRRANASDKPYTASPWTVDRLNWIELRRAREKYGVLARFLPSAFKARPSETIGLDYPRNEWVGKAFEVTNWDFDNGAEGGGPPQVTIGLTLRSTQPSVYADPTAQDGPAKPSGAPQPDRPPPNVPFVTATQQGALVSLTWGDVSSKQLAGFDIGHGLDGSPPEAATIVSIREAGTQAVMAAIPPSPRDPETGAFLPRRVWVWAVATNGLRSAVPATSTLIVVNENLIVFEQRYGPAWLGTRSNLLRHPSGSLILTSTELARNMSDADLWGRFNAFPVASGTWEAPEIDLGEDFENVRVSLEAVSRLGPGEVTGAAAPSVELDFRTAAGSYGGFTPWSSGRVTAARFLKFRIVVDAALGLPVIEDAIAIVDIAPGKQLTIDSGLFTISPAEVEAGVFITFAKTFNATPQINAQRLASSGTRPVVEVTEQSSVGFRIRIVEFNVNPVDGNGNWTAIEIEEN